MMPGLVGGPGLSVRIPGNGLGFSGSVNSVTVRSSDLV